MSTFGSGIGKPLQGQKATKAFGAPESDAEESDDGDDGEEGDDNAEISDNERAASPEKEDKRKTKLQKGMSYRDVENVKPSTNTE